MHFSSDRKEYLSSSLSRNRCSEAERCCMRTPFVCCIFCNAAFFFSYMLNRCPPPMCKQHQPENPYQSAWLCFSPYTCKIATECLTISKIAQCVNHALPPDLESFVYSLVHPTFQKRICEENMLTETVLWLFDAALKIFLHHLGKMSPACAFESASSAC